MSALKEALAKRFGAHRVHDFMWNQSDYIDLLKIELEATVPVTVIMTNGMSNYKMPVNDRYKGREFNEIFFCLPSYWKIEDRDNPKMNWPFEVIQKLAQNVIEKETWYGPGHTIANGNPTKEISETMKQEYFLLSDPILLEDFLPPLEIEGNTVHFLAIVPLFYQEYERKMKFGYPKWIKKFRAKNATEVLDDFRESVHKKRWFFNRDDG